MDTNSFRSEIARVALRKDSDSTIVRKAGESSYASWLFDFRALMLSPKWIDEYARIFWERHAADYPFQVGGMESGAIPFITAVVMKGVERGTPVNGFFIRKSRKRDGLMKRIEGTLTDDPIILVDDLIHSGQTFEKQILVLEEESKQVRSVFVILSYRDIDSYTFLKQRGIVLKTLYTLADFELSMETKSQPVLELSTRWIFRSGAPSHQFVVAKSGPVVVENFVYLGSDDGFMRALNTANGIEIWRFSIGRHPRGKGIFSTPAVTNGSIYFGAYDGNVYAIDAATGKKRWAYGDADWVGSSPSLAPELGLLFIGLEFGLWKRRGGIAALELTSGKLKWQARTPAFTHGSPLYIREECLVVIGSNDGVLYAHDAKTGVLRWRYDCGADIKSSPAYDAKRNLIVVTAMNGLVAALSVADGTLVHIREVGAGIYGSPLISGDTVFVASLDKCLYALDMHTFKERWVYETRGRIFASPALFENILWIGSNDGKLYGLEPKTGALSYSFQASERIVNKIEFDEDSGQYYVPTCANELYCLERRT